MKKCDKEVVKALFLVTGFFISMWIIDDARIFLGLIVFGWMMNLENGWKQERKDNRSINEHK